MKGLPTWIDIFNRCNPGPEGCWLWLGGVSGAGRPSIRVGKRVLYVARVVLRLRLGRPIRSKMVAAHTCDQPRCVSPEHLREESYSQNLRASWARRRRACVPSTLTED